MAHYHLAKRPLPQAMLLNISAWKLTLSALGQMTYLNLDLNWRHPSNRCDRILALVLQPNTAWRKMHLFICTQECPHTFSNESILFSASGAYC